jgi:tetratricopeptide (TPR) repeat protein
VVKSHHLGDGTSAAFQKAVSDHVGSRLEQAEAGYRGILVREPLHFDAIHLLGLVCYQAGRSEEAVELIQRAIALDASQPAAHSNLGLALQALRRMPEALDSYDEALRLDPAFVDALVNRGVALREVGRIADALANFDRALALNPDHLQAHFSHGLILLEAGRPEEAVASFERVLVADARNAAALCNLGNAFQALNRHEQALASYDSAILFEPGLAEAHSNRGNVLRDLGRPAEALASVEQALLIKPGNVGALNNRGIVLRNLGRHAEALASCEQALVAEPDYLDALCNRGNILQHLRRYEEALGSYARALRVDPGHAPTHWNESQCRLLLGDFAGGWPKYEWRWRTEQANQVRNFAQPLWLGKEPLAGRTILLHAEQGFGDTLQFCRYTSLVSALGARVVLEVQPPLKRLLASLPGVDRIVARGEALPEFDCHCPLLSLPLAFSTALETIPSGAAYIQSDPALRDRWSRRLVKAAGPRIGLVWGGSGGLRNDQRRSLALAELNGLNAEGAQLVCLQKEIDPRDLPAIAHRGDIVLLGKELSDFADTAALVDLMDLVITVDTAVAHLAGAMGKDVWILLPHAPTWRWLLERQDSPWYPSARLFRASERDDFGSAVRQVGAALRARFPTRTRRRLRVVLRQWFARVISSTRRGG